MKCPKCDYLGFETGDRCKNCGYDFSLMAAPADEPIDVMIAPPPGENAAVGDLWLDRPLFAPSGEDDDQPLIKLPAEPRAPLAVRRTPDLSRHRPAARAPKKVEHGLTLEFAEETLAELPPLPPAPTPVTQPPVVHAAVRPRIPDSVPVVPVASIGSRALAAFIDHAMLIGIDLFVVYSTLHMASLSMSDWRALPAVPLVAFLALLKLAYFSAFTAMGGQTIGKMAAGIRVVADDPLTLDPARAIGRTLTGALSLLSLGIGLIPALIGQDRRAFHDRIAHTRVVDLPSA